MALLRCTVAGLIPLMMSEKYSTGAEDYYRSHKADFEKIITDKNYYLLRDLPVDIASRIILPAMETILSRQKNDGLWFNSTKVTYDILSALQNVDVLDGLVTHKKLKADVAEKKLRASSIIILC